MGYTRWGCTWGRWIGGALRMNVGDDDTTFVTFRRHSTLASNKSSSNGNTRKRTTQLENEQKAVK